MFYRIGLVSLYSLLLYTYVFFLFFSINFHITLIFCTTANHTSFDLYDKTEKFKGSCGNLHQFTGHKSLETKGETIIDIFKIYQDYIYI